MSRFTTRWTVAPLLPDLRLVHLTAVPNGTCLRMNMRFRADHVHPELIRDLDEYFRHLSRGPFEIFPGREYEPPEFTTEYERVSPDYLPLRTFSLRIIKSHYVFGVRADMMTADMCAEINDHILGNHQGSLRSVQRPEPATLAAPNTLDVYGVRHLVAA